MYGTTKLDLNRVALKVETEPIWVNIDIAIPCGLIVNELVTNALKHAFPAGQVGQIYIIVKLQAHDRIVIKVGDDGIGLPLELNWQNTKSLGLQIVNILTNQLKGNIELNTRDFGTKFILRFSI